MIYAYVRVSSKSQIDNNSLEQQREEIKRKYPDAIIIEEQFTGSSVDDRPKLYELVGNLSKGDVFVVTKLDRFARSTQQGLNLINRLINHGVTVDILNLGIMDNTPASELIRTMFLAFAQFEKEMILERCRDGKNLAKQREGFTEGRPRKYSEEHVKSALDFILEGNSYKKASEKFGISKATLIRRKKEYDAKQLEKEM